MFRGIYPAVITPFDEEGGFSESAYVRLLDRLYRRGVNGVYVCGTTGEGMQQTVAQRKRVVEASVAATPSDRQVIVHVGAHCVEDAVTLVRHAAATGATAVSSLPMGSTFEEIRTYYQHLAAASDLPVLMYYFPELSPSLRTVEQILDLCRIENVVGLKFTDFDLYKLSIIHSEGYTILNGKDEVLAAGLLMGADGGIGTIYNLAPDAFVNLYNLCRSGQWEEARVLQADINELIRVLLRYPIFPATKQVITWSGIDAGACLPPRRKLTNEERDGLSADLEGIRLRVAELQD